MKENNLKNRIITSAWKLFHIKGYDNTTVDDIINQSGSSKGSFYYYFKGKDDLLGTLSNILDAEYTRINNGLDPKMNNFDKLISISIQIHQYMEENINYELLASLYSSQLITKAPRHLMDRNRVYYRLLADIVEEGQKRNEISSSKSISEIVNIYSMLERAFVYDWCLSKGEYSLKEHCEEYMSDLLGYLKVEK